MATEGWVLVCLLLLIIVVAVTQFSRLAKFMLELHRSERNEYHENTGKILSSLEEAIREASGHGTTNIFHGANASSQVINDDANANQIGENLGQAGNK